MNPCLSCRRDEDYCHSTGQDEYCESWRLWKHQVLLWLGQIKREQLMRAEREIQQEVTNDAQKVS